MSAFHAVDLTLIRHVSLTFVDSQDFGTANALLLPHRLTKSDPTGTVSHFSVFEMKV